MILNIDYWVRVQAPLVAILFIFFSSNWTAHAGSNPTGGLFFFSEKRIFLSTNQTSLVVFLKNAAHLCIHAFHQETLPNTCTW